MPDSPDRARICVVGSINMDLAIRTPRLPVPAETILGGPFTSSPGGKGANQAVAAARMGAAVAFVGAVGDDDPGRTLLATLTAEGIDTSRILTRPGTATGLASISIADSGENTIIVAPGANTTLTPADVEAAKPAIAEADILLLQLEIPIETAARAAAIAADRGTTVILNAAPAQRLPASLLAATDILIVNESEAAAIAAASPFGGAEASPEGLITRLAALGPRTVILTAGPAGAYFARGKEPPVHVPACPVTPVDTVGAGDAFCGTLAARIAEHQIGGGRAGVDHLAILDAVCWANAAGALATLKPGAIASLPTRAEVIAMLRTAEVPVMTDRPISLNGQWLLRADPNDEGVGENWWKFHAWWDKHDAMQVPGAWQNVLGTDYHGIAWLARIARIPREWIEDKTSRIRLRFDSVATEAIVQVNGIEVGRHSGDFLPFEFDITDAARAGWAGTAPLNPPSPDEINICLRIDEVRGGRPPTGETTERGHITKGFHDVLSCQHGGIWGDVTLRHTGLLAIAPDGIRVIPDPKTGNVHVLVELLPGHSGGRITVESSFPGTPAHAGGGEAMARVHPEETSAQATYVMGPEWRPDLWSPQNPLLAEVEVSTHDSETARLKASDHARVRFGFRTVTTGGPRNSRILLNNKPLLLRGILHWGHEPDHIAPAPTPDQVRAEFKRLRAMGFNCVCLCMWYPPRHYFDIADETGMLIWQGHPVWKSPMEEELIPEYQRLFEGFFRRDRNHPSVIIVSGSCEHERIHPDLAAWWWKRAKEENPDRLCQIQTAFTAWVNPDQTDLHDEHIYDSGGRWVSFCHDLQSALAELPEKPFVMGETIIGTSWLDTAACQAALDQMKATGSPTLQPEGLDVRSRGWSESASDIPGQTPPSPHPEGVHVPPTRDAAITPPWWFPKGLPECLAFERSIASRHGPSTLSRFRATAHRQNLATRKFQSEIFRHHPNHAGWVMNQIRDVPPARLGFMDDLGRWRFTPDQTLPWLSDQIVLLKTPDHRRGFTTGENQTLPATIGISNFGGTPYEGPVEVRLAHNHHAESLRTSTIRAGLGEVGWSDPLSIPLPAVERPTKLELSALAPQVFPNHWDLWLFPPTTDIPEHTVRLDGLPFSRKDLEPEFEERSYSSGWGLKCRTWKPLAQLPETVLFKAPLWRFDAPLPEGTRIIITHKLTRSILDFLTAGGRVILLANRSAGGLGTKFINTWAQNPLVIEGAEGPILPGDAPCVEDLLHHDLTRRTTRAIPSEDLKIADQVDPLIRLVFTHDRGSPKLMDAAFMTRIGRGLLIATSLDHTEDAGRFLMQRFLDFAASDTPECPAALDPAIARSWSI